MSECVISTPHISAPPIPYAKTVLMPGDPLRSKYVAEKYLENAVLVNNVRGVQGYTGTFNGKPVSIMASGMGMPSMGIYSNELYSQFGVETIIRIGSMGSYSSVLKLREIVLAMAVSTDSSFVEQFGLPGTFSPSADWSLLRKAAETAESRGLKYTVGNILSSDVFYDDNPERNLRWRKLGVLGVEMEAAALYMNAARAGKRALAICTVSDSLVTGEALSAEDRQ